MYRLDYNIRETIKTKFEHFSDFERADYVFRTLILIENSFTRL